MSEQITPEVFIHLVELAALELTPDEAEYLRRQLNNQLTAIDDLNQVPLDPETPPASHGVSYTLATSAPIRPDDWHPHPDPEKLLKGAPETDSGYIVVPEIPHQDLD
jgi:aspartyl-tRNA(Asn)/glutamyl-tRNA(Gln) amidotransferase subunit C